jgi:hypothetical protein
MAESSNPKDDLLVRLRNRGWSDIHDGYEDKGERGHLDLEAATEIERLRALLVRWQACCTGKHGSQMPCVPDETTEPRRKAVGMVNLHIPKAWAPYLKAVILGSLNDFEDTDLIWWLREIVRQCGDDPSDTSSGGS